MVMHVLLLESFISSVNYYYFIHIQTTLLGLFRMEFEQLHFQMQRSGMIMNITGGDKKHDDLILYYLLNLFHFDNRSVMRGCP